MSATQTVDLDRARIVHRGDGSAVVDDPTSPWKVRAWTRHDLSGRARLVRLQVDLRDPAGHGGDITAARLSRLPVAQILHLAGTSNTAPTAHPNEPYYRMLARPRPVGQRGWDDGHWARVLEVWRWAEDTGRPGGGVRAIADLWGVAVNPTAYRWLAEARRRTAGVDR
jgi:hypothetical protein